MIDLNDFRSAIQNGNEEKVRQFLEKAATEEINAYDSEHGITMLMYAATNGHGGIAQLLLKKGADINSRLFKGGTVLDIAEQTGHEEVVKILKDHSNGLLDKYLNGEIKSEWIRLNPHVTLL